MSQRINIKGVVSSKTGIYLNYLLRFKKKPYIELSKELNHLLNASWVTGLHPVGYYRMFLCENSKNFT